MSPTKQAKSQWRQRRRKAEKAKVSQSKQFAGFTFLDVTNA